MSREVHVRFRESLGVRFPRATRLVACFQYAEDARRFEKQLPDRLEGFGLEVATEKTRSMAFGRFAREAAQRKGEKPAEYTFLGFLPVRHADRHALLREDSQRVFQAQTSHQPQEARSELAEDERMGTKSQPGDA